MATLEYERETIKQIKFKLNRKYDTDIIDYLETIPNVQGYLKTLIRADIAHATPENHFSPEEPNE